MENGSILEFTYTRSIAALHDGAAFIVEWRDDPAAGAWSSTGVTGQFLNDNGTLQTIRASLAAGSPRRRLSPRLKPRPR